MLGYFARLLVVACACFIGSLAVAPSAMAEPEKCRREINKAATAYVRKAEKIVDACSKRALSRGVGLQGGSDPFANCHLGTLKKPGSALEKAESKMREQIAKKCGGDNKDCTVDDNNDSLASINWDIGTCMGIWVPDGGCSNTINHCDDVATCLTCMADATVQSAVNELLYARLNPASFHPNNKDNPDKRINKCQVEIPKRGTEFLSSKLDTLRKCWDKKLKGKAGYDDGDPCPDTDPKLSNGKPPAMAGDNKTVAKILKAEHKKVRPICQKCGGGGDKDKDLDCDEVEEPVGGVTIALGDILSPDEGFACAERTVPSSDVHPGGEPCSQYNPVDTLQKYVDCIDCQLEYKADCLSFAVLGNGSAGNADGIAYPAECFP